MTSAERRFTFELISLNGSVHHLQAESAASLDKWVSVLRSGLLRNSEQDERMDLLDVDSASRPRDKSANSDNLSGRLSIAQNDDLKSRADARLLDELAGNRVCSDCLKHKSRAILHTCRRESTQLPHYLLSAFLLSKIPSSPPLNLC